MFLLFGWLKLKLYETVLLLIGQLMDSAEHEGHKTIAVIALLVLFGIAIVGNILLTLYYLHSSFFPHFDYFMALGLLVAQPCVLSIWCALGGQKAILRIPASMGMLVVLAIIYASLLVGDGAPGEFVLILSGIVFGTTAITQIPLWIFRAITKQVIVLPAETNVGTAASQFGIKHLLISTTIAAVVVAVAQANAKHITLDGSGVPWFSLILFLAFFIIVASVLTFLILAVVFNRGHRLLFAVFLVLILIAAPLASLAVFHSMPALFANGAASPWKVREFINASCFICSMSSGIMGVLFIFYAIGFRLKKVSP